MISAVIPADGYVGAVVQGAGAALLLWAGLPKLAGRARSRRPTGSVSPRRLLRSAWSRRLLGAGEVALAVAVLLLPGRLASVLLGAVFLGFTAVHLRQLGAERCDCFGEEEQVLPARAAALTAAVALLAFAAAAVSAPSMRELLAREHAALSWAPAAALLAAFAWRLAFSGAGMLGRLADGSGALLGQEPVRVAGAGLDELVPRRSFLLRVAVVGSALATTPLRYLLYPGTALGAVVGPWDCASGRCADGYTEFCCEINQGGVNACPADTFAGGWWMCTDYTGRKLCSEQGVRYYVDCNALPGHPFPGGCRCGNDNCNNRRVACNVFRYGQCNTHIDGTTAVVCRLVVCQNPATISELHCSAALATDDAVCGHEAPCLEPPAVELVGAGGV